MTLDEVKARGARTLGSLSAIPKDSWEEFPLGRLLDMQVEIAKARAAARSRNERKWIKWRNRSLTEAVKRAERGESVYGVLWSDHGDYLFASTERALTPRPTLSGLTRLFFRVGVTVFGGGDPTIAILQREFYRRDWLSPEKFAIAFGLARLTPGTNVLAFCAAAGWYILGVGGALAAVLAITIPASVLVVWLTRAYDLTGHYRMAQSIANALLAAAVGTMIGAALLLVRTQCKPGRWLRPVAISISAFVLSYAARLTPLQVIGVAALIGFLWVEA